MAVSGTSEELRNRRAQLRRARTSRKAPTGARPTLPAAAELMYFRFLRKIIQLVHGRVEKIIIPLLDQPNQQDPGSTQGRTDALSGRVQRNLRRIEVEIGQLVVDVGVEAELVTVAAAVSRHSVTTVRRLTGIALNANDPAIGGMIPGFVRGNVGLIQRMATRQLREIKRTISAGATTGQSSASIASRLIGLRGIGERRAKLIARDQVLTLNANVTQARHQRIGITHYFWSNSNDEVVRGSEESDSMDHVSLDGLRFAYNNPPPDPRDGVTAHPGERINCRCVAVPDTSTLLDPAASA